MVPFCVRRWSDFEAAQGHGCVREGGTCCLHGSTELEWPGAPMSHFRRAQVCPYRERCSGWIAALIQNNSNLFPLRCFKIVCGEAFGLASSLEKFEAVLTLYDGCSDEGDRARTTAEGMRALQNGRKCVEQVLARIAVIAYYQSKVPV